MKTHDLEFLFGDLLPHYRSLDRFRRGLKFLTNLAVTVRYPGDDASKRQAVAAVRWAGRVRDECRAILKLRPQSAP